MPNRPNIGNIMIYDVNIEEKTKANVDTLKKIRFLTGLNNV